MIPIQPTGLGWYIGRRKMSVPQELKRLFYASWEDALWDIVQHTALPENAVVLLPEFFCWDVVKNMSAHGLRVVTYPVDLDFQTSPYEFKRYIRKYNPAIIVIFDAVGIRNSLWNHTAEWIPLVPASTVIVEDAVHRIVDPSDIKLVHPRHIVVDSLRKVVPLPGSNCYGHHNFLSFKPTAWWRTVPYQIQVFGWWAIFQIFLHIGLAVPRAWSGWWFRQAEVAMIRGYDTIGDSDKAGAGWGIWSTLAMRIKITAIRAVKEKQVQTYVQQLSKLNIKGVSLISIPVSAYGELRGFPLRLSLEIATKVLDILRSNGILVRYELNDSLWSKYQKVIYLPLGPHLKNEHLWHVINTLQRIN